MVVVTVKGTADANTIQSSRARGASAGCPPYCGHGGHLGSPRPMAGCVLRTAWRKWARPDLEVLGVAPSPSHSRLRRSSDGADHWKASGSKTGRQGDVRWRDAQTSQFLIVLPHVAKITWLSRKRPAEPRLSSRALKMSRRHRRWKVLCAAREGMRTVVAKGVAGARVAVRLSLHLSQAATNRAVRSAARPSSCPLLRS